MARGDAVGSQRLEPEFSCAIAWGPPSARVGSAARNSQSAPPAKSRANRLTVLTSFLFLSGFWILRAASGNSAPCGGSPPWLDERRASVAPDLDPVVRGIRDIHAPHASGATLIGFQKRPSTTPGSSNEAEEVKPSSTFGQSSIHEHPVRTRVGDEDPVSRDGDASRKRFEGPFETRTAPDLGLDRLPSAAKASRRPVLLLSLT